MAALDIQSPFMESIDPSINTVVPMSTPIAGQGRGAGADPNAVGVQGAPDASGEFPKAPGILDKLSTFGKSEGFKNFASGITDPTMLGTIASAYLPNSFGGRLGKGVVDIQAGKAKAEGEAADRALRTRGVEADIARSEALTGFGKEAEARAKSEFESKKTSLKRTQDFGKAIQILQTTDPGSPEWEAARDQALTIGTTEDLTRIGLIKPAVKPSYGVGEIPIPLRGAGQPGEFDRSTGEFVTGPSGVPIISTGKLDQPRFSQPTAFETPKGPALGTVQTSGPGATGVPQVIPGVSPYNKPTGKESFFSPEARAARAAKKNVEIKTDATGNVEFTEITRPDGTKFNIPLDQVDAFFKDPRSKGYARGVK